MTNPKPYKSYVAEFKREDKASEEGMTDNAFCDELGISIGQFARWRDEIELLG